MFKVIFDFHEVEERFDATQEPDLTVTWGDFDLAMAHNFLTDYADPDTHAGLRREALQKAVDYCARQGMTITMEDYISHRMVLRVVVLT